MPITSGLIDLDRIGALRAGRPSILTGHPGVGTSALAIGTALHVATHYQGSVLYVTDHLDAREIEHRLLAQAGRLAPNAPLGAAGDDTGERRRRGDQEVLERGAIAVLADADGVTPRRIEELARHLERLDEPLRLLVIDRISSLRSSQGGPTATSQLVAVLLDLVNNHQPATLLVERPTSEALESHQGPAIHPNVSVSTLFTDLAPRLQSVLWLHRPEMFDEDSPDRGIGEIHVTWQRHGSRGVVRGAFLEHLSRWANLARPPRSS